jgi:hypothetical protein
MGDQKLIATKSFGGDYECQQAWPSDTFLQCGDSGLVINRSEKDSYITAFFEAFPKDPQTFIRGEGKDLEEAELNAFKKFTKIKECHTHEYTRHGNSEHANCVKCGLFTSDYFEPTHKCSVCSKENINYQISSKDFKITYFCREHYIQKAMTFINDYDINNIPEYSGMFDEYEINKFVIKDMYFTNLSFKYKLVNEHDDEYKINNELDDKQQEFDLYCHNRIIKLHTSLNELRPENDKFAITMLMFPKIKEHLFLVPAIYEELFKEFYHIDGIRDIEKELILFHSKMYERYRKK